MLRVQLPTRGTLLCLLFLNDTTFETANRSESSPWMSKARSQLNLSSTGGNHTKEMCSPRVFVAVSQSLGVAVGLMKLRELGSPCLYRHLSSPAACPEAETHQQSPRGLLRLHE